MKKTSTRLIFSVFLSAVFLITAFCLPGTIAMAEEGDNVTDNTTSPFDGISGDDTTDNTTDIFDGSDNETDTGDDTGDEKSIPPGQLVRRGLSGPIMEVGDGYIVIETNFGLVKVYTDEEVDESMVGQRVAVKLSKNERTSTATGIESAGDNATATQTRSQYYRETEAEQFKLIPTKAKNEHRWGTVESTEEGCFFVDDQGNQIPTECSGSDEDVIGLVGESENGTGAEPALLGSEQASKIQVRIQQRLARAEEEGDQKVLQRLQTQLERYEQKQLERQEKKEARIAERAEKAKGKTEDKGNSGKDNSDKGNTGNQGQGNTNAGGNKNKNK
ncbi:MAG: hypothetical protein JW712_09480 [Dehalococcoidales bacterium]|nr:hypothetical protein [Dehalococcoidales bacterium]